MKDCKPFSALFFARLSLAILIPFCAIGKGITEPAKLDSATLSSFPCWDTSGKAGYITGKTFSLKGSNNFYVSSENGTRPIRCNRSVATKREYFTLVDAGGGKVALRSMAKYVSSEGGSRPMTCNSTSMKAPEQFILVQNANGTFSFKGNNGKFMSSGNDESAMTCNDSIIEDREQFFLIPSDSLIPGGTWHRANLTHFTSYPAPGSDECINYNGCKWAGLFAFTKGQKPEKWVKDHNVIAIHSRDAYVYKLKTFEIRKGDKTIRAKVYDECVDSDCKGCCTANADANGVGFLIDMEKYTQKRFGAEDGIVE